MDVIKEDEACETSWDEYLKSYYEMSISEAWLPVVIWEDYQKPHMT